MPRHLPRRLLSFALAGAFSATAQAQAISPASNEETQEQPVTKPQPKPKPADARAGVQSVTISAGRASELEQRRQSTAAKMIFGREELDRNGDASIGEILKRLPGVTVGGRPGRGGDIRMRGMGSGYTQILINGERAPRGFSMDSLTPDQVERIEIMRGPVAEYSTQAIAGTINIVLREEYKQKNADLKISESFERGRNSHNISLTYPGDAGALSYALSGSVFQNQQGDEVGTATVELNPAGQPSLIQNQFDQTRRRSTGVHLVPRFSYRWENGDTLMLQPFFMNTRSDSNSDSQLTQTLSSVAAPYASAFASAHAETSFARGFGNWQHKFADNARLNVKFGGGVGRMESNSLRYQYDASGKQVDLISDVDNTRDSSINTGGKYSKPLGEGHTLAAGWEIEAGNRTQTRVSLANGAPQFAESGDNLDAGTRRLALFAQDEFDISAQWSAYAGLRWEGIRTTSSTTTGAVDNRSSIWSPLLHAVWRIPGGGKDQVRVSLTHSYRAPALNDLIALPAISSLNSPTRPDRSGNPALKPELSRGIDLAYEHYLSRAGIMSANLFVRSIDDLMRRRAVLMDTVTGPRWVSSPQNVGHAVTRGIELEAKFQLQEFFPDGPTIDVRSNYSHFWSSVDHVPGPNNRLDQQPEQTANLGIDYRAAGWPLILGGNLNWTPAYVTQSSDTQISSSGLKRQLDLYGLWKFSPAVQLRLSANNLQAGDYLSGNAVTTGGIEHVDDSSAKTYTTWTLRLEMKL
ncbi:MAG: TonB-dependent receptor [Burkholderiales bacterium]|nr:TonB-dependent receptor [Burkholderiales bacterium]